MTEGNGRIKIHPILALSLLIYMLGIAVASGILVADVKSQGKELTKLAEKLEKSYVTYDTFLTSQQAMYREHDRIFKEIEIIKQKEGKP